MHSEGGRLQCRLELRRQWPTNPIPFPTHVIVSVLDVILVVNTRLVEVVVGLPKQSDADLASIYTSASMAFSGPGMYDIGHKHLALSA